MELHTIDFMEIVSHRPDQLLTPLPALFKPLPELEGWGWKFLASNHGLVFLVTSPDSGAHLRVTSLENRPSYHPGNSQGFACQERKSKHQMLEWQMPFVLCSFRKSEVLRSPVPGARTETNIYLLLFHREHLGGKCLKWLLKMAAVKKKLTLPWRRRSTYNDLELRFSTTEVGLDVNPVFASLPATDNDFISL